ncbi:hypothetical protein ACFXP7_05965 [Microbacterium sp. P06]|uniref:hypothetical protein n=1 Tax=Microbacterium sp. P06 TaxID=3366949 RepID=UPI003746119F
MRILRRAALSALGWLFTAIGVLAVMFIMGGGVPGWMSSAIGTIVALAIGVSALVPVVLGVAYLVVRARVRSAEASEHEPPVVSRASAAQSAIAAMLDSVHASGDDVLGMERRVAADRVRLTATTLAEIDDRADALSFIWFVRPSQPADFAASPQFRGLPDWARNAVVLLDLRRSLQLVGGVETFIAESGFYHHPFDRILVAAGSTGDDELGFALRAARLAAEQGGSGPERETAVERVVELLDDVQTWARVVG